MSDNNWNPDQENEEDEEEFQKYKGRDGTIYLVDASNFDDGPDNFKSVLDCIEADMLNGVIMNDKDLVGVVFYNTLHSPDPVDADVEFSISVPANMAIFMPMGPLSKEPIQYFKSFKASDDFFDFANRYGTGPMASFPDVLWLCSRMLMNCGYKLNSSLVVLFTNTVIPHAPNSVEIQKAFQRAEDFCKHNIHVMVVPMVEEFDMEPFYKEFLCICTATDTEAFRVASPAETRQQLLNRVYQRFHRTMCQRYLNVTLSDGLEFSCGIYGFSRTTKLPNKVQILRESNDLVISKRVLMCEELNEETEEMEYTRKILPGEVFKCQELGGKAVIFSSEELTTMKSLVPPGIRILGFKPLDTLPTRCFIKKMTILYPAEERIKGSTKLFRALWEKCLEKQKYILCTLTYRRKVAPRYAALVPQTEAISGNDGFRIIFMPMTTDYSHLEAFDKGAPTVSPLGEELFKKIVKKLTFSYRPDLFVNPYIQTLYSNLEALVFDEDGTELEDTTLPNTQYQDGKVEGFLHGLTDEFGKETAAAAAKRTAAAGADGDGGRAKVARKELTNQEIEEAILNGRMQIVTVQHLKDYLKSQGRQIPAKANKQELVQIIQQIFQ